ncbi:MAG: ribose-phosphate diphosphokinase [Bdellovibrionales bacterium]|nr:ribose-phosphate diphosphokinase [Bdellovibrionales bacterium]
MKLLAGTSHPLLSEEISRILKISVVPSIISRFADGEVRVEINENIKNHSVVLIQSTCPPVNENMMELFVLLDALKQAQAREITVVIPYFGYSRQDRKTKEGSPVSAHLMAHLLKTAGADRAVLLDLHSQSVENFFKIPIKHLSAVPLLAREWRKKNSHLSDVTCISPDAGGLKRAKVFSEIIEADLACIHKERSQPNQAQAIKLEGKVGKNAIIIDDMVDTAGTLCTAVDNLIQNGAENIFVSAVHGLFSSPAIQRIEQSPVKEIWVTDSVALSSSAQRCKKIKVVSTAGLLVQACTQASERN